MSISRHRTARRARVAAMFVSVSTVAAVVAALFVGDVASAATPQAWSVVPAAARPAANAGTSMRLGLAGPYDAASIAAGQAAGVSIGLVEAQWDLAEPAPGVFNVPYLLSLRQSVQTVRSAGIKVTLNIGLHNAPAWLLALPGARFVDQTGATYTGAPVPNLVFGTTLRAYAQAYVATLFATVGTNVDLVRVGGGVSGELTYPYTFASSGLVTNRYWAFDVNATVSDPVPGWKPGSPSPAGQSTKFLTWYLNALVSYQNWQIQSLRTAGYAGQVAVLYPSYGMRPGDFDKAVATNLAGTSSAVSEIT